MPKGIYTLTPSEVELLKVGASNPNLLTGYWFRKAGRETGFQFDHNFEPDGQWQLKMHSASQSQIVVIGGIGTGKTLGVGMSACVWSMLTEDFKFLNVAQKAWQAHIMWEEIVKWSAGTPFERLIEKAIERPYPKIILSFKIKDRVYRSTLEFMSVADDAMGIFSWRGDVISIEEAGHIDSLEEAVMNLSTRLTGSTPNGRPFLGRMILISNPWDNPHLWAMFDMARDDQENCLSLALSTRHNKNITEKQILNMLKKIPENERSRFLDGTRPEGRGGYFPKEHVYACESDELDETIDEALNEHTPGYHLERDYKAGITELTLAPDPEAAYIILGDPGTKNAPLRDAPVIMVWKAPKDFPKEPIELAAFWWGSGNSQIMPFVDKLLAWSGYKDDQNGLANLKFWEKAEIEPVYTPLFVGIDSTGTQKHFAELLNLQFLDEFDFANGTLPQFERRIWGLDFSGSKKATYLLILHLFIEKHLMRWPKCLAGIRQQLLNYDPKLDRGIFPKRAQDIVATLAMSAWTARGVFNVADEVIFPQNIPAPKPVRHLDRHSHRLSPETRYGSRRRPLPAAR